jgi:hypothetical protein
VADGEKVRDACRWDTEDGTPVLVPLDVEPEDYDEDEDDDDDEEE